MRANEFIVEYRDRLLQYVKSLLPTWPDYVLKDWLVPNKGDFSNLPADALKNGIMEKLQLAGLTPNSKWTLVPNQQFTMDMWKPMTKERLIGRAGGHSDMGLGVPNDKERHATQAALAQQQGGIRKEPVLLIKTAQGYELLEGWHRTIQHFAAHPNGYTGPAWVAVAENNLNEITRMPQGDFPGGKSALHRSEPQEPQHAKPLPGGSRFVYTVDRHNEIIDIYDPESNEPWQSRAQLVVSWANIPDIDNAVKVEHITVDEDYRGEGLARALYGIVLAVLKLPLVAGDSQTPGGRRMWQMLHNMPGVKVQGVMALTNSELEIGRAHV